MIYCANTKTISDTAQYEILINNLLRNFLNVTSSIVKGSEYNPKLFVIHFDDLLKHILRSIKCVRLADEEKLYTIIRCRAVYIQLLETLKTI